MAFDQPSTATGSTQLLMDLKQALPGQKSTHELAVCEAQPCLRQALQAGHL
jgi:hypothetical protein